MNNKKINLNGFKSVLKEISGINNGSDFDQLSPVIEQMEMMGSLLEEYSQIADEKDRLEMAKLIQQYNESSTLALNDLFAHYGTTYEESKSYFSDPNNFKQSEWEEIASMHEKISAAIS